LRETEQDGYNPCNNIFNNSGLLHFWQGTHNNPAFLGEDVGQTKVLYDVHVDQDANKETVH
jgi:hypothetical protein